MKISNSVCTPVLRRCIVCRLLLPREGLLRVVRQKPTGLWFLGSHQNGFGRSAYVCKQAACVEASLRNKAKAWVRALKSPIPDAIVKSLSQTMQGSS